jgi:hypothetical protein
MIYQIFPPHFCVIKTKRIGLVIAVIDYAKTLINNQRDKYLRFS